MKKLKTGEEVIYSSNPFCEHCGENFADFAAVIDDGGTKWCLTCASYDIEIPPEDLEAIKETERELAIKYYQEKIEELKMASKDKQNHLL